jgi:hypothetical protein
MTSWTKSLVVFGVGLVVVWLLVPPAWAGAKAGFNALTTAEDRRLSEQVAELLQKHGMAPADLPGTLYARVEKAKEIPAAQAELQGLLAGRSVLPVSWLGLATIVSVIVFGVVSAVCCKVTMDATLVGVIPMANYFAGNPLLRFNLWSQLDTPLQAVILLAVQVGVCYLCGSIAASIATRRNTERWKRSRRP